MSQKSQTEQEPEIVKTTVRLERKLWDAVRRRAIDERISAQEIINRALVAYLKAVKARKGGN